MKNGLVYINDFYGKCGLMNKRYNNWLYPPESVIEKLEPEPYPKGYLDWMKCNTPENTRVLIVGQGPYPYGEATGIAFHSFTPTTSLRRLAIWAKKDKCNIADWCKQGVTLINVSLTFVRNTEKKGEQPLIWRDYVGDIIKDLYNINPNCIFVSFGNVARDLIIEKINYLGSNVNFIHSIHPSYGSRINMIDNPVFEQINNLLEKKIQW